MKHILFVCTGNTCRSPMAEALFARLAEQAGIPARARSAGVVAMDGTPISSSAKTVLQEKGLPADHRSSSLSQDLIDWADLILTMTMHHKRHVIERFPDTVNKVHTLKEYAVDDPALIRDLEEHQKLLVSMQLALALNQTLDEKDQERFLELEQRLPSFDIIDPIGGSLKAYKSCAAEIEQALQSVIDKLRRQSDEPDTGHQPG